MNKLRKLVNQTVANYYLLKLKRDQWKDPQQLKDIQFEKLKAIIRYAYDHVPYYHRLFSSAKIKPEDIRNSDDLREIPFTTKQDVRKNYSDLIPRGVDASELPSSFTSGSTGPTQKFVYDYSFIRFSSASTRYLFFECGVKPSDNFVTVWGRGARSIIWGKKYVRLLGDIRRTTVPLFPPQKLINLLRQIQPDVLDTFSSVLSTLAKYDASGINPRLIFTQGEVVPPHCRDLAKKVLDSELFETYGSVEFEILGFECEKHCGLHMMTNGTYIEFVDEDGEYVSPGEQGEIIVTGLRNHVMPLIRYRIGDLGIPTDEKCPCGRSWPLMRSVHGRVNDYLVLPSGREIPAGWLYVERIVDPELKKNLFSVAQYQIIQERKNRIILKVVKGRKFDPEMLERIKNNLETYFARLGEEIEVVMQVVKEIPKGRTGKKKDFISILQ